MGKSHDAGYRKRDAEHTISHHAAPPREPVLAMRSPPRLSERISQQQFVQHLLFLDAIWHDGVYTGARDTISTARPHFNLQHGAEFRQNPNPLTLSRLYDFAEDARDAAAWSFATAIFAPEAHDQALRYVAATLCAAQAALDSVNGNAARAVRYQQGMFESLVGEFEAAHTAMELYAIEAGLQGDDLSKLLDEMDDEELDDLDPDDEENGE